MGVDIVLTVMLLLATQVRADVEQQALRLLVPRDQEARQSADAAVRIRERLF